MAKKQARGRKPLPFALAIVICDAIWQDSASGKRFLLGMFSSIASRTFPATHPLMAVYAAFTGGHGTVQIKVRIVDAAEEHEPLFEQMADIPFPSPLAIVEWDLHIPGLVFPQQGEYRVQFLAGNEPLIERRLLLIQVPET